MKISNPDRQKRTPSLDEATGIAVAAFAYLAAEPERVARFAAITGIDPRHMRDAARQPGFFLAVLNHLAGHEPDLLAFAEASRIAPGQIAAAQHVLEAE